MEKLIADIKQDTINTSFITGVKQIDPRVIEAIASINREHFVRPADKNFAFEDRPLEIGFGQTISQPFIVALMIHLIEPKKRDIALEVGSGSGYLVAILSRLVKMCYGVELISELAALSVNNLAREKITNVKIIHSDGSLGLPHYAPFDNIIVSAAATKMPQLLLDQLAIGGRLILPKSQSPYEQMLTLIRKKSASEFKIMEILPVRFVPFINS